MTVKEVNSLILNKSINGRYYWVSCSNDECNICKTTKEEAIDVWNKRTEN